MRDACKHPDRSQITRPASAPCRASRRINPPPALSLPFTPSRSLSLAAKLARSRVGALRTCPGEPVVLLTDGWMDLRASRETLMTRKVNEPMRRLMNDLVREVIRAWREEFCRAISIKLNAGFLL